jgi:histone H3
MQFLNHHYTHNSDATTCACLKRTPVTINITNHGPCQTNSLEIYWGKTSTPSYSHKGCTTVHATSNSREKALPLCPGTVALREICKFQKTTNLLIRNAPFQHLICKLAQKRGKSNLQMQSTAVLALQEAAEYFMIDILSDINCE